MNKKSGKYTVCQKVKDAMDGHNFQKGKIPGGGGHN